VAGGIGITRVFADAKIDVSAFTPVKLTLAVPGDRVLAALNCSLQVPRTWIAAGLNLRTQ
jgi:hypothetical protein